MLPRTTCLRDVQAIFCGRRHQPRRPPLAKIRPGSPAPTIRGERDCRPKKFGGVQETKQVNTHLPAVVSQEDERNRKHSGSSSQRPLGQSSRVAFRLTGTSSGQVGLPVRIPASWHGGTRIGSQFWDSGSQCRGRGVDSTTRPLPPGGVLCTGPDFRKRKKSRNQVGSPNWNRMQRCGIGGEGETGAFKCLTPST
jgi:hypothetical protein